MSNWQEKAIQDIQIGDMVIGFDEERTSPENLGKYMPLKLQMFSNGKQKFGN